MFIKDFADTAFNTGIQDLMSVSFSVNDTLFFAWHQMHDDEYAFSRETLTEAQATRNLCANIVHFDNEHGISGNASIEITQHVVHYTTCGGTQFGWYHDFEESTVRFFIIGRNPLPSSTLRAAALAVDWREVKASEYRWSRQFQEPSLTESRY